MAKLISRFFTVLFFWVNSCDLHAQSFHYLNIPVYKNGEKMDNPWAGGMNAPQWALFDINNDGKKDLYAFDRTGDVHLSFLNMGNNVGEINYQYSREWLRYFPAVHHFVLMRDFNGDGVVDIFCSAHDEFLNGFKVYKGFMENGFLHFERIRFPAYDHDIIPYVFNEKIAGQINVYLNVDYPAIDDIDGDGDLDILTMNAGGNKVHFYKNISLEKGFSTDTLLYELADDCWGKFGLTVDTQALSLSLDPNMCAFFNNPDIYSENKIVHGGTTLCTFDSDGDGDKDILYGDLLNQYIIFGKNDGNMFEAWMTEQDTLFPVYDTPIEIPFFASTFIFDLNNDGKKDLMASPNQIWFTPDVETAWFYENIGSETFPEYNLIQKDFLSDNMLDFGTGANPTFTDVNADGLTDIVCGNREHWTPDGKFSQLHLLLNKGTADEPVFEVTDEDWLGLSQYLSEMAAPSPAFGDLDNDGDLDLLIGDFNGYLHFAENTAGAGMSMQFPTFQFNWKNIDVGQFATPFIHDMNKDGLPDLLIGELKGTVNYLPNIGTLENPDFHPVPEEAPNNHFFGEINTQPPGGTVGYTQPFILEFGDTMYLVTGSFRGWIKRYLINPDSLDSGTFALLDEAWGGIREGASTRIAFANLNNDEYVDAIVGNTRGGMTVFQSPISVDGIINSTILFPEKNNFYNIYPNPTAGILQVNTSEKIDVKIYDVLGRQVYFLENITGEHTIDLGKNNSGIYIVLIKHKNGLLTERVVLLKP